MADSFGDSEKHHAIAQLSSIFDKHLCYNRVISLRACNKEVILSDLCEYPKFKFCSGGFLLFLKTCTEETFNTICDIVEQETLSTSKRGCIQWKARIVRHAWCCLSKKIKNEWDREARRLTKKTLGFAAMPLEQAPEVCSSDQDIAVDLYLEPARNKIPVANSSSFPTTVEGGLSKANERDVNPSMPRCEVPFRSSGKIIQDEYEHLLRKSKEIRCPRCTKITLFANFVKHMRKSHTLVRLYGCHVCFEAFCTINALKSHVCPGFAQYLMNSLIRNEEVKMKFVTQSLVCAECNMQLPIPRKFLSDDFKERLRNLLLLHNCASLLSCLVYFACKPDGLEYVTIRFVSACNIPLSCSYCHHDYTSLSDMEKHQVMAHRSSTQTKMCPFCSKLFGTNLLYRAHVAEHLGEDSSMVPFIETVVTDLDSGMRTNDFILNNFETLGNGKEELSNEDDSTLLLDQRRRKIWQDNLQEHQKELTEKKKFSKKNNLEKCYNCKQLKALFPKRTVPPNSCKCRSLLAVEKRCDVTISLGGKHNSFLECLRERFTRESRLNVGPGAKPYDSAVGTLLMEGVAFCFNCCGLFIGLCNVEKHIELCLQNKASSLLHRKITSKQSNLVIKLSDLNSPSNSRLWCPLCSETSCSLTSLRRHMVIVHGVYCPLNLSEPSENIGVYNFTKLRKKKFSTADEIINRAVGLTNDGQFLIGLIGPQSVATAKDRKRKSMSAPCTDKESLLEVTSTNYQNALQSDLLKEKPKIMKRAASSTTGELGLKKARLNESSASKRLNVGMKSVTEVEKWHAKSSRGRKACLVCQSSFDSSQMLADHFTKMHLYLCVLCGTGFNTCAGLEKHGGLCRSWQRTVPDGEFLPHCSRCSHTLPTPERYYYHLVQYHLSELRIDSESSEVTPMFIWKKVPLAEAQRKKEVYPDVLFSQKNTLIPLQQNSDNMQLISSLAPTTSQTGSCGVTPKGLSYSSSTSVSTVVFPTDEQLKAPHCVMCGTGFKSERELTFHYSSHIENWTSCPVCLCSLKCFAVKGFPELYQHLIRAHIRRSCNNQGPRVVCGLCYTSYTCDAISATAKQRLEEKMVCHILFSCQAAHMCFLCCDGKRIPPELLEIHRRSKHSLSYDRFGCSSCGKKFSNCGGFLNHFCGKGVMCSCGERKFFSETQYHCHFESHLNRAQDFCLLCNKFLPTVKIMENHRELHKAINQVDRKMIEYDFLKKSITNSEFPKDKTSYVQRNQIGAANNAVITTVHEEASSQPLVGHHSFISQKKGKQHLEMPEKGNSSSNEELHSDEPLVSLPQESISNVRSVCDSFSISNTPVHVCSSERILAIETSLTEIVDESVVDLMKDLVQEVCSLANERTLGSGLEKDKSRIQAPLEKNSDAIDKDNFCGERGAHTVGPQDVSKLQISSEQLASINVSRDDSFKPDVITQQRQPTNNINSVHMTEKVTGSISSNYTQSILKEASTPRGPETRAFTVSTIVSSAVELDKNPTSSVKKKKVSDNIAQMTDSGEQCHFIFHCLPNSASRSTLERVVQENDLNSEAVIEKPSDPSTRNPELNFFESDKTSDDDIEYLGTFDGSGLQGAKKREFQIQCSRCAQKFMTVASLNAHTLSHRYDAGHTLDKVYGLPVGAAVFVCRLCCLAYECWSTFKQHTAVHGPLLNCKECSVVAFNDQQLQMHVKQHQNTNFALRLTYVCSECMCSYSSEERLFLHMFRKHKHPVIYFCKCCGFGCTDGSIVYWHIVKNDCCLQMQEQLWTNNKTASMGFTSAGMFHYQPISPDVYEREVQAQQKIIVKPSECIHRSFLMAANERVCITCPICCTLTGLLRLQAENPTFAAKIPRPLYRGQDDNEQLINYVLNTWKKQRAPNTAQSSSISVRTATSPQLNKNQILQPTVVTAIPIHSVFQANRVGAAFSIQTASPSGAITWPSTNYSSVPSTFTVAQGTTSQLLQSTAAATNMQLQRQPQQNVYQVSGICPTALPTNLSSSADSAFNTGVGHGLATASFNPLRPSNDYRIVADQSQSLIRRSTRVNSFVYRPLVQSAIANGTPSEKQFSLQSRSQTLATSGQSSNSVIPFDKEFIRQLLDNKLTCIRPECHGLVIDKVALAHVHCLRHKLHQTHFCLECGEGFIDEPSSVKHQIMVHRNGKLPAVELICPLCHEMRVFSSLEEFAEHLKEKISDHCMLRHFTRSRGCTLFFASIEAMRAHEADHYRAQSGTCCALCGTAQYYWITPATDKVPRLSHTLLHAFMLWSMCRECGLCFPYEPKRDQFVAHFKQVHIDYQSSLCKVCDINIYQLQQKEHALTRHFVLGMRSDRTRSVVVRVDPELLYYHLGITRGKKNS